MKSVQLRSYFWSVFSCIRIEYGDLRRKSPYSIRIQENTDQSAKYFGKLSILKMYITDCIKTIKKLIWSEIANYHYLGALLLSCRRVISDENPLRADPCLYNRKTHALSRNLSLWCITAVASKIVLSCYRSNQRLI